MKIKRDVAFISSILKASGTRVLAKEDCSIVFPERYLEKMLATIGEDIYVYGVFAIMAPEGQYSTTLINSKIRTVPSNIEDITIGDTKYKKLNYNKGDVLIADTNVVKSELDVTTLFDDFILRGKLPFFMDYEILGELMDTAKLHGGSKLGGNTVVMELLVSMIAKDPNEPSKPFRLSNAKEPMFVSLQDMHYSIKGSINKLSGAYFNEGLNSALVEPDKELTEIEKILRA